VHAARIRRVIVDRKIPERWRSEAAADRWLLLIRLSNHPELPDVLSRPIGELAHRPLTSAGGDDSLPVDMWSVELLQALLYWRRQAAVPQPYPRLTLVLSCWDELDITDATPAALARERLALLDGYCSATWPSGAFDVVGLSAQGHRLHDDKPSDDYLDHGPQQMGWFVTSDGRQDDDLTALVADER